MGKTFGVDFREDVEINKMKLDVECEVQPSMYYHYSAQLSDARAAQDAAKLKLDYILGARQIAIRMNPPDGIKITEAVVEACIAVDGEVMTAKEDFAQATAKVGTLYSAVNALEQRKSMLDNLTKLHISNSYQDSTGSDIRAGMNNRG